MKRVLTAVVLIPLVLLAVFRAPLWLFALLVAGIAVLALHEYLNIVKGYGIEPVRWMTYFITVAGFVFLSLFTRYYPAHWYSSLPWAVMLMLPLVMGIPVLFRRNLGMAVAASASSAFGILYIAIPLAVLILLRCMPGCPIYIVFVLFSVWAGDVAAYYVGKNFGRHKLAPLVSPNKTWEGAIASLAASVITAMLVFHFRSQINNLFAAAGSYWLFPPPMPLASPEFGFIPSILGLGIVTNIAAQCGDLFESALKRGAQIKDSGSLLPGHGGILDRIDALFFAIPVVWYYANFHPAGIFATS